MEVLLEICDAGDAGEAGQTEVLPQIQVPRGTRETDRLDALSEIGEAGDETDRMDDALSEIGDAGGETDRMSVSASPLLQTSNLFGVWGGGRRGYSPPPPPPPPTTSPPTHPTNRCRRQHDALLVIGDAGDNGAAWMEAHLERKFERICKQNGGFEVPSQGAECFCIRPFCAGMWLECSFECWKRVGFGAKVASGPSDKHQ